MDKLKEYIKKILDILKKPEMEILPSNIAFNIILAIIPLFTIIVLLASTFDLSISLVIDLIKKIMPTQVSSILIDVISGKGFDGSIGFFNIAAFVLASNGMYALITAADQIYHVENINIIKKRVSSIILLIIVIVLLLFLLVVPVFGTNILNILQKADILNRYSNDIILVFDILKWPVTLLIVYFNIKLIYTIAPSKNIKSSSTTKGAIFTTFMWIISTVIFKFYLKHFARYDILYGNLASIIILMIWVYFISYIFTLGMAINVSVVEANNK